MRRLLILLGLLIVPALCTAQSGTGRVSRGASLPAACRVGDVHMLTSGTSGQRIYGCESTNTWVLQGDGGGAGGDSVFVNGGAAVDVNLINTAATGTVPSVTITLNATPNPDEVTFTVGAASGTEAGVVTTGTQTLAGQKTFSGLILPSSIGSSSYQVVTSATTGADHCAKIETARAALGGSDGIIDAESLEGDSVCAGTFSVTSGVSLRMPPVKITPNSTVIMRQKAVMECRFANSPGASQACILAAKNSLDSPILKCESTIGPSDWCHGSIIRGIRFEGNSANQTTRTIAAAPTGASRTSNITTFTTTASHGFTAGRSVIIRGVTNTTFNGIYQINTTPTGTTFTVDNAGSDTTSGSGTAIGHDSDCLNIIQPGENFTLDNIFVNDCAHSGLRVEGIMSGSNKVEQVSAHGNGIAAHYFQVASSHIADVIKGDCNKDAFVAISYKAGAGGGTFHFNKIQAESCGADNDPFILHDGKNSGGYVQIGLLAPPSGSHTNIIRCVGANDCSFMIKDNQVATNYTNMITDEAFPGGTRTILVTDIVGGQFQQWPQSFSFNFPYWLDTYLSFGRATRTLSNGANNNVQLGSSGQRTYVTISGPTAEFGITGLVNGSNDGVCGTTCVQDGRLAIIYNTTAQNMYFAHESGSSGAPYRIVTKTGAQLNTGPNSVAFLIYSKTDNRWHLLNDPYAATASNASTTVLRDTSGNIPASVYTGLQNFTSATARAPNAVNPPGTCTVGDYYAVSNATRGENLLYCAATNVWVPVRGQGDRVVFAKDYNNGATTTCGIQEAITALAAGIGGTVVLEGSQCTTSTTILINDGTTSTNQYVLIKGFGNKGTRNLLYTGTGFAFDVGKTTANTDGVEFHDLIVGVNNNSGNGIRVQRGRRTRFQNMMVDGSAAPAGYGNVAITLDGTTTGGAWMADTTLENVRGACWQKGVSFIGTGSNESSVTTTKIIGGEFQPCGSGGTGLDLNSGTTTMVIGTIIENWTTAVRVATRDNYIAAHLESNTTDFNFDNATWSAAEKNIVAGTCGTCVFSGNTSKQFYMQSDNFSWRDDLAGFHDDGDVSKKARFQLSGITTATTRTYTVPNADGTLPLLSLAQTWSADQTLAANLLASGTRDIGTTSTRFNAGFFTTVNASLYATATNCADGAGAAACGSAAAGSFVIDAGTTSTVVSTTAVTADSEIFIQEDSSLGTRLSATCNTTIARQYVVTARTAGTSFTVTASAAPVTNPACLSYKIVN